MSSSNSVRLAVIPEVTYNITPPSGDFTEMKFTGESLTGTPLTAESTEIRSDRQGSGQVGTGLELSGDINTEMSSGAVQRMFIEAAMMSTQTTPAGATVSITNFTPKGAGRENEVSMDVTGTLPSGFGTGSVFNLTGGMTGVNEGAAFMVTYYEPALDPLAFDCVANVDLAIESTQPINTIDMQLYDYWDIGSVLRSFSISKEFLDVDDGNVRSIAYTGERVGSMAMTFNYGEIVTSVFGFGGSGYAIPTDPITNARTVVAAGTASQFDASNGMPYVALMSDPQDPSLADVCIEALGVTLNNNLTPQQCVGELAPSNQVAFSAAIEVTARLYNGTAGFDALMLKKLSQTPIQIGWQVQDSDGNGYAFFLPRVQLNFPDPSAGSKDDFVFLEAAGMASYDEVTGTSLRISEIV